MLCCLIALDYIMWCFQLVKKSNLLFYFLCCSCSCVLNSFLFLIEFDFTALHYIAKFPYVLDCTAVYASQHRAVTCLWKDVLSYTSMGIYSHHRMHWHYTSSFHLTFLHIIMFMSSSLPLLTCFPRFIFFCYALHWIAPPYSTLQCNLIHCTPQQCTTSNYLALSTLQCNTVYYVAL